jgi:hypothetical protein
MISRSEPKIRLDGTQKVFSRPLESKIPDTQVQTMALFLKSVAGNCPCDRCQGYRDLIEGIEL